MTDKTVSACKCCLEDVGTVNMHNGKCNECKHLHPTPTHSPTETEKPPENGYIDYGNGNIIPPTETVSDYKNKEVSMREIKFRVWSGNMWLDGGDSNIHPVDSDSVDISLISSYPHQQNIMCQYTGLKDKNGKEIYEGDILEGKKPKDYGVVVYMQPQFVVDPISDHKINTLGEGQVGIDKLKYSQVVGNIYENKELL